MEKEVINNNIELRSEKVRNIVGKIPPATIRYGILTISIVIVFIFGISMLIPYRESLQMKVKFSPENSLAIGIGEIDYYYHSILYVGMPVQLNIDNTLIEGRIKEIEKHRINGHCRIYIELSKLDVIDLPITTRGNLSFTKQSYFEKVLSLYR